MFSGHCPQVSGQADGRGVEERVQDGSQERRPVLHHQGPQAARQSTAQPGGDHQKPRNLPPQDDSQVGCAYRDSQGFYVHTHLWRYTRAPLSLHKCAL